MENKSGGSSRKVEAHRKARADRDDDEGMLFEMEDEGFVRRRSRSIDSFCSDHTVGESSRETSVAPQLDRTDSLRIANINRLGKAEHHGSLPHSRKQNIPSINFQFSVPAPVEHTWEDSLGLASREYSSSLDSVEEATEDDHTPGNYNSIRRSNNLDISEASFISKSPRFLPKFLRASFSRLISKDKSKTVVPRIEPVSLPFFSTSTPVTRSPSLSMGHSDMSVDSIDIIENETDNNDSADCSPTTKQFVEESVARGLPIIPFYYSTAEIVEKRRWQKRNKHLHEISSQFNLEEKGLKKSRKAKSVSPDRSNIDKDELCNRLSEKEMHDIKMENNSLQSLLRTAKKEMEEEASVRKVSDITGYASNNSRALQRRRSSVSEYVGMSLESKDPYRQEKQESEYLNSQLKPSSSRLKNPTSQHKILRRNFSGDQQKQRDGDIENTVVIRRHFAHRVPSIGQYLDMDCGLKKMTAVSS